MIKTFLDLIEFFNSNFPLLLTLAVYTPLAVILAKSIKKYDTAYYWVFGVISFFFIIPVTCRLLGITLPFNMRGIPIIGMAGSELSSAANFIHPILIIIMYMGALSPKIPAVGRLMSIRKELSIIVGFPVLAHCMKRVFSTFLEGWAFFFNHEEYMSNPRVVSVLGSGIQSFAFVLGIVMTVLFLVLWITSFDSVHRKLGAKKWKSVQRWSYGLYAMLFLHSLCLETGGLITYNARMEQQAQKAKTEIVSSAPQGAGAAAVQNNVAATQPQGKGGAAQAQAAPAGHGKSRSFAFADIEIPRNIKSWIKIFILISIYGSYLYFRLRKARRSRARKATAQV